MATVETAATAPPRTPFWKWSRSTASHVEYYQNLILSRLKDPYKVEKVEIEVNNNREAINTLTMPPKENHDESKPNLLLLHGFGGGIGIWNMSLSPLSTRYNVYSIDMPGFANSSRLQFPNDPKQAEDLLVDSIEEWRKRQGIDKLVVAGHSFGGYVAGCYSLKYSKNVSHCVLMDPWGLPEKPKDVHSNRPLWQRALISVVGSMPPLAIMRAAGPWGLSLITKLRKNLGIEYRKHLESDDDFYNYLYHCNAQTPSGELAFHTLSVPVGWAKLPLIGRLTELDTSVPLTFLYGQKSWIDPSSGKAVQESRLNTQLHMIPDAGHHLVWDNAEAFNRHVLDLADSL